MARLPPRSNFPDSDEPEGFRVPLPAIVIGAAALLLAFGLYFIYSQATTPQHNDRAVDATPNFATYSGQRASVPVAASNNASGNPGNSTSSSSRSSNDDLPRNLSPKSPGGLQSKSTKSSAGSDEGSIASLSAGSAANSKKPGPRMSREGSESDSAGGKISKAPAIVDPRDEFFTQGVIPELRIFVTDAEFATLVSAPSQLAKSEPLTYVHAGILEGRSKRYEDVAIKLEGGPGDFRPVKDRPSLTISMDRFQKKLNFHGFTKFHLCNSVQDETYINEWLAAELFRAANVPAPLVTHARIWLNTRELGLYVLKAEPDSSFLARHFGQGNGNVYEGGLVRDIDADLSSEEGEGDQSDLKALLAACREPSLTSRWDRLEKLLNIEEFISFMAMELMLGHRYGYTVSHNDYRLFFDAATRRAHFLPYGTDRVFINTEDSIVDFPSSVAASAVMQNPAWRARYRERIGELLPLFSPPDEILQRVDTIHDRLRPAFTTMAQHLALTHNSHVRDLKERIEERAENLAAQVMEPDPKPDRFDRSGRLTLDTWSWATESAGAVLQVVGLPKVPRAYSITCSSAENCHASWRCKALLGKGNYVLHAKIKADKITGADEKRQLSGAGIRVAGAPPSNYRKGTFNWTPFEMAFTVPEEMRMVEFVLEIRARRGQVWFDADSIFLTRSDGEKPEKPQPARKPQPVGSATSE
jgi:hypothetical protein